MTFNALWNTAVKYPFVYSLVGEYTTLIYKLLIGLEWQERAFTSSLIENVDDLWMKTKYEVVYD